MLLVNLTQSATDSELINVAINKPLTNNSCQVRVPKNNHKTELRKLGPKTHATDSARMEIIDCLPVRYN